ARRSKAGRPWSDRTAGMVLMVLLAGCASAPQAGGAPAGRRPGIMSVLLTSEIRSEPLPAERLLRPDIKTSIAMCEQMLGPEGRCGRETTPGPERDRFSPDEHERVYAFVVLQDLEPARSYEVSARWYRPDGGVTGRATKRLIVPQAAKPSFTIELHFWSAVKTLKPGRWRVEIAI